ncbi:hypothetical protein ETAA8_49810 [Anatilimnocola aggregata]|uniref:PIN domain-containing protein n=1 Tax=Anatilimnocola aggregata TaxID=2528021 RepID=A0A517YI26_9BACT|nr:hypothetical protein ETAA8_49810 [Anatilimnocola aggregata]
MILLDTNLLVRIVRASDSQCALVRATIHSLLAQGEQLVIVPQSVFEFWAVATRSTGPPPSGRNGLGMSPAQTVHWLRFFRRRFTFLPDREDLTLLWQSLVETHNVTGFRAHDVRLVAVMQSYGITRLMTFNAADFRNLPVTIVDPRI